MGAPSQSSLNSPSLKDMILENKGMVLENKGTISSTNPSCTNGSLWSKILEVQRTTLSQTRRRESIYTRKNKRVLMKRRRIIRRAGSKRGETRIEKRVQTLKKLIPHRQSKGLDGLFKDTAAYIVDLQMRARVMQIMVDMLTSSQNQQ